MRLRTVPLLLALSLAAGAVIIDRIAIVVDNSIIKDSDIERDVRVTDYLNQTHLDLSDAAKKQAASRLIDQIYIRREIDTGGYPSATLQEADRQLEKLKSERSRSAAGLDRTLRAYGTNLLDLRTEFQWQLTVLRFVDVRFKPGAVVTDDEIASYFDQHSAELRKQNPGKTTLDDLRQVIRDLLSGQKVNEQFFAWLDDKRKTSKIEYREEYLK